MSYNDSPKWTNKITYPGKNQLTCPTCGHVAGNVDEVMLILMQGDYYAPRHIPPTLVLACDNSECLRCDDDYEFELAVTITATRAVKP